LILKDEKQNEKSEAKIYLGFSQNLGFYNYYFHGVNKEKSQQIT